MKLLKPILEHLLYIIVVFLLIMNVIFLIKFIEQSSKTNEMNLQIKELKQLIEQRPTVINGTNGYTPVKGVDYFDGQNGQDGADGQNGKDGTNGLSAYQIALRNGFVGSEEEWLTSLKAPLPLFQCNDAKNRWEVKYFGDTQWSLPNGQVSPCLGVQP